MSCAPSVCRTLLDWWTKVDVVRVEVVSKAKRIDTDVTGNLGYSANASVRQVRQPASAGATGDDEAAKE
jgi:hypothetical protein